MQKLNSQWSEEKARKHLKIAAILIILSAVYGLALSIDDFLNLGRQISAFVLPYLINIISFVVSIVQIYVGISLLKAKPWTKIAVFCIIGARLVLGYYDYAELRIGLVILVYFLYIIWPSKAGWLFKKHNQSIDIHQ